MFVHVWQQRLLIADHPIEIDDLVRKCAEFVREAHFVCSSRFRFEIEAVILFANILIEDLVVRPLHFHVHVILTAGDDLHLDRAVRVLLNILEKALIRIIGQFERQFDTSSK